MTRALKWWLALGVIVVFFAGVATGLFAGAWHARRTFIGGHSAHFHQRMRNHLQRELQLTSEQSEQVGPILDRMTQQLDAIREETGRRVGVTMSQSHDEMLPLLTPEQQKKLNEMRERHRRMQRMHGDAPPPPDEAR